MVGGRTYTSKTTVNANINDEEFQTNVKKAQELAETIHALDELEAIFEKISALLPPSSNLQQEELGELPFRIVLPNISENGASSSSKPHKIKIKRPKEEEKFKEKDSDKERGERDKEPPQKRRARAKDDKSFQRKVEVLDTSLLRPLLSDPSLNLSDAQMERTARSMAHLTGIVNAMRLKAGKDIFYLPFNEIHNENGNANIKEEPETRDQDDEMKEEVGKGLDKNSHIRDAWQLHARPFLSEDMIARYWQKKHVFATKYELQDGDVIHAPFNKDERRRADDARLRAGSNQEWAHILHTSLPGRSLADCERYIQAFNAGTGYSINQTIIYRTPCARRGLTRNISDIMLERETSARLTSNAKVMFNTVRTALFPLYRQVSVSPVCGGPTIDVKFDPSGQRDVLLVGCAKNDGATGSNFSMLYDLKTGKSTVLDKHQDTVTESLFTIDGKRLITAGHPSTINVWNSDTAEFVIDLVEAADLGAAWQPSRLSTHHYDPTIVAACPKEEKGVYVWKMKEEIFDKDDVTSVNLKHSASIPGALNEMDFSRGLYAHLLVGASDQKASTDRRKRNDKSKSAGWAVVFDVATHSEVGHVVPHDAQISCVRTSPDGTLFVTGSGDGSAAITDMRTFGVVQKYYTYQPDITVVTFSKCGNFITTSGEDNRVFVFDARCAKAGAKGAALHVLEHTPIVKKSADEEHDGVSSTIWTNYGELLISGGEDNAIRIWDIRRADPLVHFLQLHNAPVSTVAISKNDQLISSGGLDWQVRLYSQVSSTDDPLQPYFKLSQTLLTEMSNTNAPDSSVV